MRSVLVLFFLNKMPWSYINISEEQKVLLLLKISILTEDWDFAIEILSQNQSPLKLSPTHSLGARYTMLFIVSKMCIHIIRFLDTPLFAYRDSLNARCYFRVIRLLGYSAAIICNLHSAHFDIIVCFNGISNNIITIYSQNKSCSVRSLQQWKLTFPICWKG